MKVTKIASQVKNPNRVSIYLDAAYAFSLTFDQLLTSGLKAGAELDAQDVENYRKLSDEGKLKARTLEWLMMRPRSGLELRQYLRRKNADPELIDAWAEEFAEKRYQDDASFAVWWVEQRRRGKQRSSSYIRSELLAKGIASELIDSALAEEEISEQQALRALIDKKITSSRYADRKKLIAYLQRQGYRYSAILDALTGDE